MKTGRGVVRVASLRRSVKRSGKTPTENESNEALNTLADSYEEESRRWGEGQPSPQTEAGVTRPESRLNQTAQLVGNEPFEVTARSQDRARQSPAPRHLGASSPSGNA